MKLHDTIILYVLFILLQYSMLGQTYTEYLQQGKIHLNNQNYPSAYERFCLAYEIALTEIEKKDAESLRNVSFRYLQKQYKEMDLKLRTNDTLIKKLMATLDDLYFFKDQYGLAHKNKKFGYIDRNGNVLIPFVYDQASPFSMSSGFAIVGRNHKRYLIDTLGTEYLLAENPASVTIETLALDLSNKDLTEIPQQVYNCTNLVILLLNNNKIKSIPQKIIKLQNLQFLDLSENKIENLPDEFGNLLKIKFITLRGNQLGRLPDSFSQLIMLEELYINNNNLFILPQAFGQLNKLVTLDLDNNKLKIIPEGFGNLHSIKTLSIRGNDLEKIPESLGNLNLLENLSIDENHIVDLPSGLSNLKGLKQFNISRNRIGNIPVEFKKLTNLRELDLRGNNIPEDKKGMIRSWLPNCNVLF